MNTDKIIRDSPKGFKELLRYYKIKGKPTRVRYIESHSHIEIIIDDRFVHFIYFRKLYDYFDSVGIEIQIDNHWVAYCNGKQMSWATKAFDTRTEAEYVAFEKAFEIRENRIKVKQ